MIFLFLNLFSNTHTEVMGFAGNQQMKTLIYCFFPVSAVSLETCVSVISVTLLSAVKKPLEQECV